jgi:hypothetical protein
MSSTPESPTIADIFTLVAENRNALRRLEERQSALETQEPPRMFYSTKEFAERVERSEYTVRQWCKNGRINAQKRPGGRGAYDEWQIPASEPQRYRDFGFLPRLK